MTQVQTAKTVATSRSAKNEPAAARNVRSSLQQCLVVSPSPERVLLFQQAAEEQGWKTIVAMEPENAAREAVRNRIHLAVIDLQSVSASEQPVYRQLVELLAKEPTEAPLMLVCGAEDDAMGEIWSRELGVWMYLPGIDDQTDIAMLCGEARNVAEKLQGSPAVI